jgi:hypothetical protein
MEWPEEKAEGYRAMPAHLPHATPMYHHKVDPEAAPSEEMRLRSSFIFDDFSTEFDWPVHPRQKEEEARILRMGAAQFTVEPIVLPTHQEAPQWEPLNQDEASMLLEETSAEEIPEVLAIHGRVQSEWEVNTDAGIGAMIQIGSESRDVDRALEAQVKDSSATLLQQSARLSNPPLTSEIEFTQSQFFWHCVFCQGAASRGGEGCYEARTRDFNCHRYVEHGYTCVGPRQDRRCVIDRCVGDCELCADFKVGMVPDKRKGICVDKERTSGGGGGQSTRDKIDNNTPPNLTPEPPEPVTTPKICTCRHGSQAGPNTDPPCLYSHELCASCAPLYYLNKGRCEQSKCSCKHGLPATKCMDNEDLNCRKCVPGFHLDEYKDNDTKKHNFYLEMRIPRNTCKRNVCTCKHGIPATGEACTVHQSEICSKCDAPYRLTQEKTCKVSSCNGCVRTCQDKLDKNAWLLSIQLALGNIPIAVPDALQDAVSNIFPLTHTRVKHVGFTQLVLASEVAGTMNSTSAKTQHAIKLANKINKKLKQFAKDAGKQVKQVLTPLRERMHPKEGTEAKNGTQEDDTEEVEGTDDGTELKELSIRELLSIAGLDKGSIDSFLAIMKTQLGRIDLQKSLESVEASTNSTSLTFKAALVVEGLGKIGIKLSAQDYSKPTQDDKESICQPERKVLGWRYAGGMDFKGKGRQLFNTMSGRMNFDAMYVDKQHWEASGKYTGTGGSTLYVATRTTDPRAFSIDMSSLTANFAVTPDKVWMNSDGETIKTEKGGLHADFSAQGSVVLPMISKKTALRNLAFGYHFERGWAFKLDAEAELGGGKVAVTATGLHRLEWPGALWQLEMKTTGSSSIDLAKMKPFDQSKDAHLLPKIHPGGSIALTLTDSSMDKYESESWSSSESMQGLIKVQYPQIPVLGNEQDHDVEMMPNFLRVRKATVEVNANLGGIASKPQHGCLQL